MVRKSPWVRWVVVLVCALVAVPALAQTPVGTAFAYQGRLVEGGSPATGSYDFRLVLFDASGAGTQVGPTLVREDVTVSDGLFTLTLDFGSTAFAGNARWLEVAVRPGASTGAFTPLAPRQELTPSPNATFGATTPWTGVLAKPAGFADDTDNDLLGGLSCANGQVAKFSGTAWGCAADADSGGDITAVTAGTGLTGGGTTGAVTVGVNPASVQSRVTGTCAGGSAIGTVNQDGSVVCQLDGSPGAWSLTGNAGTNPGTNFIGTTDAQPLELRVAGQRVLRIEDVIAGGDASVNVLGGLSINTVSAGITGATIAGGGLLADGFISPNQVTANFGTVGGGLGNVAGGQRSTVAGGSDNTASGEHSTVGGGIVNAASGIQSTVAGGGSNITSGTQSTVAGGIGNIASGIQSTVAGGFGNIASGSGSAVPGGEANDAGGDYSFAAGRRADVRDAAEAGETGICSSGFDCGDEGTFVWAGAQLASFVSTGPNQFLVRAAGGVGINTNAPATALHVNGTATVTGLRLPTGAIPGFVLTSDGSGNGSWQAASAGDITAVAAGVGLSGGGTSGGVSLAVDTAAIQSRVAGVCAAGSSIRTVNPNGTVVCETTATNFSGSLAGEVTGTQGATVVSNAVSTNTANAIVRRDASGNFAAGTVTANLAGNATTATTATSFSGSLGGEVTGTQAATVVSNAVSTNTASAIVRRDASGNFAGGTLTLAGNLALPNTSSDTVGVVTIGGARFLHRFGTSNTFVGAGAGNTTLTGTSNTVVGQAALAFNTTGGGNSAFGFFAMRLNTGGFFNSAFGANALESNTTGIGNSTFGSSALRGNTTGNNNSAFGFGALDVSADGANNSAFGADALGSSLTASNNSAFGAKAMELNSTGGGNSAFGEQALQSNTTGSNNSAFGLLALESNIDGGSNSAFGTSALRNLTSGSSNIALGLGAGFSLQTGSGNVYIGHFGVVTESNTIRVGTSQTAAFMAGIFGQTSAAGVAVLVNSSGKLGTATSSRRYKEDIVDLGAESDALMRLRPVAFRYRPEHDETRTRQYGLVAEEVAEVAPQLVVFDAQGQPETVRYHFVNAMLLNEVQKQRRLVEEQQSRIQDLEGRMKALEALLGLEPRP